MSGPMRLRLGCGKADRWPDFGLLLSAQSPVFLRKYGISGTTHQAHKPRVTRSIRVIAATGRNTIFFSPQTGQDVFESY